MEQGALKEVDIFILSGLTQAPTHNPDSMMGEICMTVVSTLRNGGNVIFPCYPSGIIYDLFECLANHLDSTGYGTYPFYFIAPQAETSLAYSNILAEW
jgi:integrator complex subunit 9